MSLETMPSLVLNRPKIYGHSDASHDLVIDYQHLLTPTGLIQTVPSPCFNHDDKHMNHHEKNTTPLEIHKLKEHLKLLQERVDQQIKKFTVLKNSVSP